MISFTSLFENTNVDILDPKRFFWMAVSVPEAATINPKGTRTLLANGVINGKPTDINGLKKLWNHPSWLVIFLGVPFKNILFSKDIIAFISFISLLFLNPLTMPFWMPSTNPLLYWFSHLTLFLLNSVFYQYYLITAPAGFIKSRKLNFPNCIILDNWDAEDFILAHEPFAKASRIFEACMLVKNNLWGKWVSSLDSPTAFDESFKGTPVLILILDFTILDFILDLLYWLIVFFYHGHH